MKHFVYLYLSLPLLLISAATSSDDNICTSPADINEICKAATAGKPPNERDFCVSKLRADARTKSADAHGLAVAAVRLALDHATSTENKIGLLADLEDEGPAGDERLSVCLDVYTDAIDVTQDALESLNAKLYGSATGLLRSAVEEARKCREVFQNESPLAVDDEDFARLASIALGITASLSRSGSCKPASSDQKSYDQI